MMVGLIAVIAAVLAVAGADPAPLLASECRYSPASPTIYALERSPDDL
jgi:hypothetical protein